MPALLRRGREGGARRLLGAVRAVAASASCSAGMHRLLLLPLRRRYNSPNTLAQLRALPPQPSLRPTRLFLLPASSTAAALSVTRQSVSALARHAKAPAGEPLTSASWRNVPACCRRTCASSPPSRPRAWDCSTPPPTPFGANAHCRPPLVSRRRRCRAACNPRFPLFFSLCSQLPRFDVVIMRQFMDQQRVLKDEVYELFK